MADDKKAPKSKAEAETKKSKASQGLNTAGLVLGILSIVFAAIFISAPLGLLLGIIGLVLAIVYKAKGGEKSSGLVLTIIGTAVSIFMTILFAFVVGTVITILASGIVGDWACTTADGNDVTIDIGTGGYKIDGESVNLSDLKIDNVNISTDNGQSKTTVSLHSNTTSYTCIKH